MREAWPRLIGFALVAASCGTTWLHRSIYVAARGGPAQATELAMGLTTFLLASAGILLLLHGATLLGRGRRAPAATRGSPSPDLFERLTDPVTPAGRAFDTRRGVAAIQARRALLAASDPPIIPRQSGRAAPATGRARR